MAEKQPNLGKNIMVQPLEFCILKSYFIEILIVSISFYEGD